MGGGVKPLARRAAMGVARLSAGWTRPYQLCWPCPGWGQRRLAFRV